ncbi:MAG: DNA replication and repair protein RecF [Spirochaetaceae bacterium]|jgi:DNA replication and repair protein RecF|nr:DNA replication and repair protein RecF [Spirochaetaceae bacterium]
MFFQSLRTVAFRNLADDQIDTGAKNVFLVGINGQGKSNFLEAVYFCAYASSFRRGKETDLVKTGEKACSAAAVFSGSPYNDVLIKLEKGRKMIYVNGKKLEDRRELLSVVPCIVFCHEDMEFVSGSPEMRRWFFDQSQSLYDPVYLDDLRKYRKLLKMRNTVLREKGGTAEAGLSAMLDAIDPQLIQHGLALMEKRSRAAAHFSHLFGLLYEKVSDIAGINIRYTPSWKSTSLESIGSVLFEHRFQDVAFGTTLSGPHRDRYSFFQGKNEFAAKASTGQRRLLTLLLRVAQACCFSEMTGNKPLLLLDDVLLELDTEKRRRFLEALPEYEQAFYTFLPGEPYEQYKKEDALLYTVSEGRLRPVSTKG